MLERGTEGGTEGGGERAAGMELVSALLISYCLAMVPVQLSFWST